VPDTNLYFAYTALLAPEAIASMAPNAEFLFTAHFPATRLRFMANGVGTVATLEEDSEHTVWGGVFSVPDTEMEAIAKAESEEGRQPGWEMKAVDRGGNKHDCLTFVGPKELSTEASPDSSYVAQIIRGARHWKLPAGWVVGLEDLLEDQASS
jgi:cation transport regulator ChaC